MVSLQNIQPDPSLQILILDLSHGYGGSSSRLLGLMSRFSPHEMALAAVQGRPLAAAARRQGLTVYEIGKHKLDPFILPRLVRLIRKGGFRLIDTQNIQSKWWGSLAAMLTGAALVSTLNSWYTVEHGGSLKGRLYTALELLTNFRIDGYIVVSESIRQAVLQAGIRAEMVDLIYNAVEIDPQTISGDPSWLRRQFHLPEDAIVCTAVGRLVWAKGYEDLIQALAEIAAEEPRLNCLIVGEGELRKKLEELILEKGMDRRIQLVGFRERQEVWSILKASDLFVMPSRQEGTPLALLEATALGKPILATSCGGIPELVQHGQEAFLVPVGDPSQLGLGLLRLSRDPHLAKQLGIQAQRKIQSAFNLEAQAEATRRAYLKAMQHRKGKK
jgi:glycosyltransferase involved in cell wall biosynthesis